MAVPEPLRSPFLLEYAERMLQAEGLGGLTPEKVLAVPDDVFRGTALEALLTPRRLSGLEAALRRIKARVRELTASAC